jgi:ribosomal protein S18 acetylase RimI-like enzyme
LEATEPSPELRRLLLATHEGTRDCPELDDSRTPDEVFAGFCPGGSVGCSRWHTIDDYSDPVGVLLLDEGIEPLTLDLSYLGIVPAARRRGFGWTAVGFALRIAAESDYRALTLSVDARNEPALRLYRRHGFIETERRGVWLLQLPGEPGASATGCGTTPPRR